MSRLLCAFVCFWLSLEVCADICPYQECDCMDEMIYCDFRGLSHMPARLNVTNTELRILTLENNQISTVQAGSLPPGLSEISFLHNPIADIDDSAFDESLSTLTSLKFSDARFTQLPTAVTRLTNLLILSCSNTTVFSWDVQGMSRLGSSVLQLTLSNLAQTEWPTWIYNFTRLTVLTVTGGQIFRLADHALDNVLHSLISLDLSNNRLTSVPKAVFNLTALDTLILSGNLIKDLAWLPPFSRLSKLMLNNNRITNASLLSQVLPPYASTLETFDISGNLLSCIPELPFLTQITALDLSNNKIFDPDQGSIPTSLNTLILSFNLLTTIPSVLTNWSFQYAILHLDHNRFTLVPGDKFPQSTTGVELGYNQITQLTEQSFPLNSPITYLYLYFNPLTYVSPTAFINLPQLRELNIRNTLLTRLPLAITSLTSLSEIDVSGSEHLVCTCEEKSLQARIQQISPEDVFGNCGMMTVLEFFTVWSPQCPTES